MVSHHSSQILWWLLMCLLDKAKLCFLEFSALYFSGESREILLGDLEGRSKTATNLYLTCIVADLLSSLCGHETETGSTFSWVLLQLVQLLGQVYV